MASVTCVENIVPALGAGMFIKLAMDPVFEFVKRRNVAFVQVPPVKKSESSCNAASVPPGLVDVPPIVARIALPCLLYTSDAADE